MFNSTEYNTIPLNSQTRMFPIPTRIITVIDKGFKKARAISKNFKSFGKLRTQARSNTRLK